jgi:hypothetical protein
MIPEASPALTSALEGVILVMLLALLYYALRILTAFKKGILERGWRIMSQGIIVLVAGELVTTVSYSVSLGGYLYQLGTGLDALGVCIVVLGLKSHCDIWLVGSKDPDQIQIQDQKIVTSLVSSEQEF